jgi:hypothetical protein
MLINTPLAPLNRCLRPKQIREERRRDRRSHAAAWVVGGLAANTGTVCTGPMRAHFPCSAPRWKNCRST